MSARLRLPTARGTARVAFTDRSDGDLGDDADPADRAAATAAVCAHPWTLPRQVHGNRVLVVGRPGDGAGEEADALVTTCPGAALAVRGADCAVVALVSPEGVVGVAHAGWRGLLAGILPRTVEVMRAQGAARVEAFLGPCIGPTRYEFAAGDLDDLARVLGPDVRAATGWGTPALDVAAGVRSALGACGVEVDERFHRCTAADPLLYSHRDRADRGRHAAVVWLEPA